LRINCYLLTVMSSTRFQNTVLQGISPFNNLLLEFLVGVQLALLLRCSQAAQQRTKFVLVHIFGVLHHFKAVFRSNVRASLYVGERVTLCLLLTHLAGNLTARFYRYPLISRPVTIGHPVDADICPLNHARI